MVLAKGAEARWQKRQKHGIGECVHPERHPHIGLMTSQAYQRNSKPPKMVLGAARYMEVSQLERIKIRPNGSIKNIGLMSLAKMSV